MLNLTIVAYVGPNSDSSCLARPWVFDITSTIFFAPLIAKLYRVDRLFNYPKLKKMKITDLQVALQVLALLCVDFLLLLIWTFVETPRADTVMTTYASVYLPVADVKCSTGLSNVMEVIMVVWKGLQLAFGVYEAAVTWNAPSDLSEAKFFAMAIYNIVAIGGLAYFLAYFLSTSTSISAGVSLSSLTGISSSTNVCCHRSCCNVWECLSVPLSRLLSSWFRSL